VFHKTGKLLKPPIHPWALVRTEQAHLAAALFVRRVEAVEDVDREDSHGPAGPVVTVRRLP
jgi:hypothetical protein